MGKRIISLTVLLITAIAVLRASGKEDVGFPKLKGWKLFVSPDVYTPGNLWDLINGAAESYISYDFVDLHLADYRDKEGNEIHAELYRHSSSNNAFGIYSSERSPDYNFQDLGTQGYLDEGVLNFVTGQFYVKLYSTGSDDGIQESLLKIGRSVSDHLKQENDWPHLLTLFPSDGKREHTDHYVRENFIGLNFLHTAFTVEYQGDYRLFVIEASNTEEIYDMVGAYLAFTKQEINFEQDTSFTIKDRYNGDIPVVITGSCIAGIIDGADNESAKKNLEMLVNNLANE